MTPRASLNIPELGAGNPETSRVSRSLRKSLRRRGAETELIPYSANLWVTPPHMLEIE